jgi:flagellar motor switch/type III secretory pathway protein FliN
MPPRPSGATVQPFPWHALGSTTRAEARAARALRRAAERLVRVDELGRVLSELVSARIDVISRGVAIGGMGTSDGVGVLLGPAERASDLVLIEVEGALATALAARALRRKAPVLVDPTRGPSEHVAGAVAALLIAAARRAHADTPLVVRSVGPARALTPFLGPDVVVASFTVLLDDDAYLARAAVPRAQLVVAPSSPWSREALAALGDTPLRVPIVAVATLATAADVASLRVGDAWMPGGWELGPLEGNLQGPVTLAAPGATEGLRAALREDGRLFLVGDRVELSMQDDQTVNEAMGQALGDVPVVVRVEIGAAEMPAREWAALGKGDVLALGAKIADPVVLRVGGVEVARGELVEIDGEVGVRILSRRDASAK